VSLIEIRALGTLELNGPGEHTDPAAILSRPKRAAILAYLACARPHGPRRRDELIGMFWPEIDQDRAGRALNQSVYVLRSVIGEDAVRTRGSEIVLDPELVRCDAVAFEAALVAGDTRTAIDLYGGEFLRGFYLSGSRTFERWLDDEREHYRLQATEAAAGLATEAETAANLAEATRWMRHAIELSPFEESFLRRLLSLLMRQGDRANAVRELERFAMRLREELGMEVSADTRSLVRRPHRVASDPPGTTDRVEPELPGAARRVAPPSSERAATSADARPERELPRTGRRGRGARTLAIATLAAASIVIAGWWARTLFDGASQVSSPSRTRVLVAPLENRTDDPSLDRVGRIAADWISRGLIETGLLEVVPGESSGRDLSSWSSEGESAGAELVVTGSLQRDGADVVLTAFVLDVHGGTILRSVEPIAAPESTPLPAIERLRRRTAGALATVVDPRMAEWADIASQPPGFESYRMYAEGLELLEDERYLEAGDRFLEAAARDSTFTSAVVWAIEAYSLVGQGPHDSLALALASRRDGLATWDRAMLDHHLARMRGDLRGEYEALRRLVRLSPTAQWQVLLAQLALWINRPGEALEILDQLEPEDVRGIPRRMYWGVGLESLHMLGEYDRELDRVRRWGEATTSMPWYGEASELRALAAVGRAADVVQRVDDDPGLQDWTWQTADRLRRIALELRVHGHPDASRAILERVFDLYEVAPDSVRRDPVNRRQLGRCLFTAGRWEESRVLFEQLLAEGYDSLVTRGDVAVAAAGLGDRARAEEIERWYARWAADTPSQKGWATQWRARIVALLGDRDRAVRLITQAHEEGWPHWTWDELVEEYDGLRGYAPFEDVMRPRE